MAISAAPFYRPQADLAAAAREPHAGAPAGPQEAPARNAPRAAPARGDEMLDLLVATFGTISEYRPNCHPNCP